MLSPGYTLLYWKILKEKTTVFMIMVIFPRRAAGFFYEYFPFILGSRFMKLYLQDNKRIDRFK